MRSFWRHHSFYFREGSLYSIAAVAFCTCIAVSGYAKRPRAVGATHSLCAWSLHGKGWGFARIKYAKDSHFYWRNWFHTASVGCVSIVGHLAVYPCQMRPTYLVARITKQYFDGGNTRSYEHRLHPTVSHVARNVCINVI